MDVIQKMISALDKISGQLQILLISVGIVFFILGAIQLIFGSPESIPQAKKRMIFAISGVVLGLVAKGIIQFFKTMFSGF